MRSLIRKCRLLRTAEKSSMLNLFDTDIHSSPTFGILPKFSSVRLKEFIDDKIQHYQVSREERDATLLGLTVIRKDDESVWEACEDLLGRSVKDASPQVHGVYRFRLLGFDVHNEINRFNFQDLTQLIINHSRKLQTGQEVLIKYCSCYGLLRKTLDEQWGKITFQPNVYIFDKDPQEIDLFIKRIVNAAHYVNPPLIVVINDQSLNPIWDVKNELQKERLQQYLQKSFAEAEERPEIYLHDRQKTTELMSTLSR